MEIDLMTISTHPVTPANIQSELSRIWESLETKSVARACLFNLIFYTQKNHRTAYIERVAQNVVEKFPSRVLFVTLDSATSDDFLKTEVSILSSSKGEFDVACDYIRIDSSKASQERVSSVVLPHLLSDLPVFLIWAEDPSKDDPLRYQLEQFANRLIFDSETTDNLPLFASSILAHHEKTHCDIADLNWARIENWREMLSLAFHSENNCNQIQRCKKITMTYNAQSSAFFCHTHIQSIYLQTWLGCQLGWNLQSMKKEKNALLFTYQGSLHPIEISLVAAEYASLPPGVILSIEIETADKEHFSFQRHLEKLNQITFQHSTHDKCDLPSHYIFSKAESGHSLVKEICHRGTSEHFLKVLHLIKNMNNLNLC